MFELRLEASRSEVHAYKDRKHVSQMGFEQPDICMCQLGFDYLH